MNTILFVHRYYWPDCAPYGLIIKSLGEFLYQNGWQVSVFTTTPNYHNQLKRNKTKLKEKENGITIRRLCLFSSRLRKRIPRTILEIYYSLNCALHVLTTRSELVVCSTMPPVITAFLLSFCCFLRGKKFIYHCMDLYPEILFLKKRNFGPAIKKFLLSLDNFTIMNSKIVIVLSADMKNQLINRGIKGDNIMILNNPAQKDHTEIKSRVISNQRFAKIRFVFVGNIGRYQSLENVIKAVITLPKSVSVELIIIGGGSEKAKLQNLVNDKIGHKVVFLPYMPFGQLKEFIKCADFGVVSLRDNCIKMAYPSKVGSLLSLGIPLFVTVGSKCELTRMVIDTNCGVVCEKNEIVYIRKTIIEKCLDHVKNTEMKRCAMALGEKEFNFNIFNKRFSQIISSIQ